VAAHEECNQHLFQYLVLTNDDLAHLLHNALAYRVEALNPLLELGCIWLQIGKSSHQLPSL